MMRGAAAGIAVAIALLACAGSALADSATLAVTTDAGVSDPVAYIPRNFTLSGSGAAGTYLFVKHRAAGGPPCAASAYTDSGTFLDASFYGVPVNGAFTMRRVLTWRAPGTWMLCYWFASSETKFATPITQIISVRQPPGSITATANPSPVTAGEQATITVSGTTEASRRVYAKIRTADGTPCGPTFDSDPGGGMISGWTVGAAFSITTYLNNPVLGQYLVCTWLAGDEDDQLPVAASSQVVDVVRGRPIVVSRVNVLDCRTRTTLKRVRVKRIRSVCLRFRFSSAPLRGETLSLSYVTPKRRTYKTVSLKSAGGKSQTLVKAALPVRAYRHRHGNWRAILRVPGHQVSSIRFKVTN
jgi:hypothetical protein